jgi:hypothetical protein
MTMRHAIGRDTVIIVAFDGVAGVDFNKLRRIERNPEHAAITIDEQARIVGHPVRRLDQPIGSKQLLNRARGQPVNTDGAAHQPSMGR